MKTIKSIVAGAFLAFSLAAFSQDEDGKIVVEITKDVNGEKKTFKGEYNSTEEMRADPNYQEFSGEDKDFNFWFDSGDEDIVINIDKLKDMDRHIFRFFDEDDDPNGFFFHMDDDSSKIFDFNMNGFDFEELEEKMKELGIEMSRGFHHLHRDKGERVKIIDLKKIRISDVENEFGKRGKVNKNEELELDDLAFYPNPSSSGKIKVRFNTQDEDELSIKVSNLEGKEVFSRYFESFSGRYSESIDLSGQKEGIYLLEIIQGNKRLTRKIIVN